MSVETELARILGAANTLKSKGKSFGIITEEESQTIKIDGVAEKFDAIINQGNVSAEVKEGETYTIPEGYHDGSGTVTGVTGGGNYKLQSKTATPTKKQQRITPDSGNYGLSDVTIEPIPQNYQDTTAVTATAEDILATKIAVGKDGSIITGTMANNGAITKKLTTEEASYLIPAGYHSGGGTVSIDLETKDATPSTEVQTIEPSSGKVISQITIQAIPEQYKDTSDATATAENILQGATAYVGGKKVTGTMANNSSTTKTLTAKDASYVIPAGYHDGAGMVQVVPETKVATPSKEEQQITSTDGKILSQVTVEAIPEQFIETTDATAVASDILANKTAYIDGQKVTGTMTNNSSFSQTIDGLTTTECTIPAGFHDGTGKISLTNDIEMRLAAI